jgi:AAA+ ATPase superfamily predicted ATPase
LNAETAFVNRERELATLDELWAHPGSQFLVLYGRRRVGKTTLMLHWGAGKSTLFWTARRTSPANLLGDFSRALYRFERPESQLDPAFAYPSWEMAFRHLAQLAADRRILLVLDELPYAFAADPALASTLQVLWDHHLSHTQLFLVIAGSVVGMIEQELLAYNAPLYGRATAKMLLSPLPLSALSDFYPRYSDVQRLTVYAIVGGIPTYLRVFDDGRPVGDNVRQRILSEVSLFLNEPYFLIQDEIQQPRNHLAVLQAIGGGQRRLSDIAQAAGLDRSHVGKYLNTLVRLRLVQRIVPVTVRQPARSRRGRYVIADPYLRFYFRFLAPRQEWIEQGRLDRLWTEIERQLDAFVGLTAFETLCRRWTIAQGDAGRLSFVPERVGAYWDRHTQVDVAAISWSEQSLLLGEAKWTHQPVGTDVLDALQAKTTAVRAALARDANAQDAVPWAIQYVLFAQSGFTAALRARAADEGVRLVSLQEIAQAT